MRFISPSYADHSTSTQTIAGSLTAAYSIRSVSVLVRERLGSDIMCCEINPAESERKQIVSRGKSLMIKFSSTYGRILPVCKISA